MRVEPESDTAVGERDTLYVDATLLRPSIATR